MIELLLAEPLQNFLTQWPLIAVIVAIGWFMWSEFKHCMTHILDQNDALIKAVLDRDHE